MNLLGTDGSILAMNQANSGVSGVPTVTLWAYADQSGSIATWGRIAANGDFDLYHRQFGSFGEEKAEYGSTSEQLFNTSEQIFNGWRVDPISGRFQTAQGLYDPITSRRFTPGNATPENPNPYLLGNNDPLNYGRVQPS